MEDWPPELVAYELRQHGAEKLPEKVLSAVISKVQHGQFGGAHLLEAAAHPDDSLYTTHWMPRIASELHLVVRARALMPS